MAHINALHTHQLAYLNKQVSLSPLASVVLSVAVTVNKWSTRARTRRALLELDAHLLRDIGIDRGEAYREARRMFWQG